MQKVVFKSVFLLTIILSSVVFTPFVFGQEFKKATWLENASIIYDQAYSKSIISSITFETVNNQEIKIPDKLIEKLSSHKEIKMVMFTNAGECIMGVSQLEQCILIVFDLPLVMGDGGINAVHANSKAIAAELIDDLNELFNLNAEFHSIWVETGDARDMTSPTAGFTSGAGIATVAYTMPKQTTSNAFANLSERLVLEDIRNAGGYFTAAKQMANFPENMTLETSVSLLIVMDMENPLFVLKVMHEEFRLTWADAEDGGLAFDRIPMDISEIYPLTSLVVDKLERSKHFENHFVPLNSIIQVVIIPENPSKITSVKTNVIPKLDSVEDVSQNGWVFVSTSPEKIDVRYIFGMSDSVTADELFLEVGPTDVESESNLFVTEDAKSANQDAGGEQYVILIVIVIAAIGAALFYLKGYRRNR